MIGRGRPIAFDFDGTLVSCAPRQIAVLRAVLRQYSAGAIDLAEHWRLKREGASTLSALLAQGLHEVLAAIVGRVWRMEVERLPWLALDTPFKAVNSLLTELLRSGFQLVLVSGRASPAMLRLQLEQNRMNRLFSAVHAVSPFSVLEGKASVLRRIQPAIYFGDTEVDAHAAALSGTPFVAVASGQRSETYLTAQDVSPIYPDVVSAANSVFAHVPKE